MSTCLIVDDSPVIRKVARHIMESHGFAVVEAWDGPEGLEAAARAMPDAVIVDSAMPGMNGFEFLRKLRGMESGRKPKVLVCAVDNDVGILARARHCGADSLLLKPFDSEALDARLRSVGLI